MKKTIKCFVSYSQKNKKSVNALLEELNDHFKIDPLFNYEFWHDDQLEIGNKWHEKIQKAVVDCDYGLLMVSISFLASDYIVQNELPVFAGECGKPCFPIMIDDIDFDRHETHGLKDLQIYRYEGKKQGKYSFNSCKKEKKSDFVRQLYIKIHDQLKSTHGATNA